MLTVMIVGLSACGGSSSGAENTSTVGRYVTAVNISKYKGGTPQQAILNWWRAVQFDNASVAHGFYEASVAPEMTELQRELSAASSQFVGVPKFNSTDLHDGKGTVYFFLSRPGSSTPPRPLSVNLIKAKGEWRLADNLLLEQQVARVAKLLREREESHG